MERQRGEILPVQFGGSGVRARGEEPGRVGGVQAVHVFVRPDRPEDDLLVDVGGQGELNQNAVDGGVVVPLGDLIQ